MDAWGAVQRARQCIRPEHISELQMEVQRINEGALRHSMHSFFHAHEPASTRPGNECNGYAILHFGVQVEGMSNLTTLGDYFEAAVLSVSGDCRDAFESYSFSLHEYFCRREQLLPNPTCCLTFRGLLAEAEDFFEGYPHQGGYYDSDEEVLQRMEASMAK